MVEEHSTYQLFQVVKGRSDEYELIMYASYDSLGAARRQANLHLKSWAIFESKLVDRSAGLELDL